MRVTLYQRGYPTTLMNKKIGISSKNNIKRNTSRQNIATKYPLHTSQLTIKTPKLFREIKNLDELKKQNKIKEILDKIKIIKSQRQPYFFLNTDFFSIWGTHNAKVPKFKYKIMKYVIQLQKENPITFKTPKWHSLKRKISVTIPKT